MASHLPETVGNPTPKKISQSYSSEDLDEPLHENIGWYPVKISSCSFWKDGISYLTGIKLSNQELFTLYYKGRTISRILFCYCLDLEEGKRKLDLITHDGWRYIVDSFCHKSDVSPKNGILENYFHVNLKPKVDMNMGIKEKPKRNGYLRMEKIHNNIDINVKYNDRHSNKPKRK